MHDASLPTDLIPFAKALEAQGLDLVQAFDAARYNDALGTEERVRPLPLFGRESALGIVIGNTRALWPPFLDAFARDDQLRRSSDPLDTYVCRHVDAAVTDLPFRCVIYYSHRREPQLVSMLRVADASGLARLGPAYLAIHPDHGPWFALRALVVGDAPPPDSAPPPAVDHCAHCPAPCRPALQRALDAVTETGSLTGCWRRWVAVRDACPIGRPSRYDPQQIRYHYTKDRSILRALTGTDEGGGT